MKLSKKVVKKIVNVAMRDTSQHYNDLCAELERMELYVDGPSQNRLVTLDELQVGPVKDEHEA